MECSQECRTCGCEKAISEFGVLRKKSGCIWAKKHCKPCEAKKAKDIRALRAPELASEIYRSDYLRNRDKKLDYARRRVVDGTRREYMRGWRERNPDYYKDLYIERKGLNPEIYAAYARNRRARLKSAEGLHTAEDIAAIRKRQKDCCACCRIALNGDGEVDHIVSIFKGGSNWPSNLQFLCLSCNRKKGVKDFDEFMREMEQTNG